MGGKSQDTDASQTTSVETTTTTSMGDVGLTGQHAIDLTNIINSGEIERTMISADLVKSINLESGNMFSQLIGGATNFMENAAGFSAALVGTGGAAARDVVEFGALQSAEVQERGFALISDLSEKAADKDKGELEKALPFIILGIVGLVTLPIMFKRGRG